MPLGSILYKAAGVILLLFAAALLAQVFLIRPWYLHWGATEEERLMPLPGDRFIPPDSDVTTRAITIHAPPERIWPWMLQIGQERGGFFSYFWLENLFGADMPTEDHALPSTPPLTVGESVSMMGGGDEATKLHVSVIEPERALAFDGWTLYLQPVDAETTRLIVRYPFQVGTAGSMAYYYGTFEMWHFIMETGMMMGIKQRAESLQSQAISAGG